MTVKEFTGRKDERVPSLLGSREESPNKKPLL
jgi:hypothetical protein